MSMRIRIQEADFDLGEEVRLLAATQPGIGAIASFVGLVRDTNLQTGVQQLRLEHYPGMTEQALEKILVEATERWSLLGTTVIHRVGPLAPTDQIVLVAAASAHRGAAFAACEFIMDYLKTRVPIWKCEDTDAGRRWIDARASDADAANRWKKP